MRQWKGGWAAHVVKVGVLRLQRYGGRHGGDRGI
jgi:hypothetical protein